MLHQYLGRHIRRCVVELLHECGQDFGRLVVLRAGHKEVVAPDEFALPYEEHLDPRLARAGRRRNHIQVLRCEMQHLLPFVDLFDCGELVAQRRRLLKLERFGGVQHTLLDGTHHLVGLAFQEQRHLVYHFGVFLLVDCADAGAYAAVDMEVEAGAGVFSGDGLGTGTIGEELFEQVERAAHAAGVCEWAEIARAVLADAPRDIDLREVFSHIDFDERVTLIVLEAGVVGRLMLFYQVAL